MVVQRMVTNRRTINALVAGGVAAQPFNSYEVIGILSVADVGLLLALAGLVLYQLFSGQESLVVGVKYPVILLLALLGWILIAMNGWRATEYFGFLLMVLMVGLFARSVTDLETLLWGALIGAFVIAVPTVYSVFFDPSFGGRVIGDRSTGPLPALARTTGVQYTNFGAFSTYLLAPLPFAILKWWRERHSCLLIPIVIIIVAALSFQSRATWIAMAAAAGVLITGLVGRRLWNAAWRNAGASGIITVAGAGLIVALVRILIQIKEQNVTNRLRDYIQAVELIRQYPLTGVTPPFGQYFHNMPHNDLLLFGAMGGLFAMILFGALFGVSAIGFWRGWHRSNQQRWLSLGTSAGLAANLMNMSFAPATTRIVWVLVAIGGILIIAEDDSLPMVKWYQNAVSNSSTITVLRNPAVIKIFIMFLTVDMTDTRLKLESAWRKSQPRAIFSNLPKVITGSTIWRLLK